MKIHPKAVRLEFSGEALVYANLSGAAFSGDYLWVAGDEACGLERLRRLPCVGDETLRFGEPTNFPLATLLDLPGAADEEADLEGMALADGYLWIVGSHSLKRKNAKPGKAHAENAKRLSTLSLDPNRRLLARIPVACDGSGAPVLLRAGEGARQARRLKGDDQDNELTELLADDAHFGAYLAIPGKDNGFDIEGLAVDGERVFLGLRGPVLRGWAGLLEIAVEEKGEWLRLSELPGREEKLHKHFLALDGLGVRDLHFDGDDLYILAGATLVLDGAIRLYRWRGARQALANNREPVAFWSAFELLTELPHGPGCDRAEAFCEVPAALTGGVPMWLALYDAPGESRKDGEFTVFGDLLSEYSAS